MKHLNEYRYFKVRKSYWNEKDPNEPFFNKPKGEYKKQKDKESNIELNKEFIKNFNLVKPLLEECYELLKNREIDKISSHGIMLSNGSVLEFYSDDEGEYWDLYLNDKKIGVCDTEYDLDWENNKGYYNSECNELVMSILQEILKIRGEEGRKQVWKKYKK